IGVGFCLKYGRILPLETVGFRLIRLDSAPEYEYGRIPSQNMVGFRPRIGYDSLYPEGFCPRKRILPQKTVGFRSRIGYDCTKNTEGFCPEETDSAPEYGRIPPHKTVGFRPRIGRILPQKTVDPAPGI
ncbi:hypothetical protein Hamer_G010044, partial [Homarus americanus]